jgi:hypothetical protein
LAKSYVLDANPNVTCKREDAAECIMTQENHEMDADAEYGMKVILGQNTAPLLTPLLKPTIIGPGGVHGREMAGFGLPAVEADLRDTSSLASNRGKTSRH